jgi:hypothetical protein
MDSQIKSMFLLEGKTLEETIRKIIKEEISIMVKTITREPKALTRQQAAEKINVCENTISQYVKVGLLKNRGAGRKILIHDTDLEGFKTKFISRNRMN